MTRIIRKRNKLGQFTKASLWENIAFMRAVKQISLKLLALALIVGLNGAGLSTIGETIAFYNDTEASDANLITADKLDFTLNEESWTPAGEELDLRAGDSVSRKITIVDDQSIDFKYIVSPEKTSGDDDFCNALELEVSLEGVPQPQYSGLIFNFLSETTTFALTADEWVFNVSLPASSPELNNKSCYFDFVFSGWQEEFPNEGEGYNDVEFSSNTIQSGEPFDPTVCPFDEGPGRQVVYFNNKGLRSDKTQNDATDGPVVGFIPTGTYDITLASYDSHLTKPTQVQPNEQWELIMKNAAGTEVAVTDPIRDIVDAIEEQVVEKVEEDFDISEDVSLFTAFHSAYPDPEDNPNSLRALCAMFEGEDLEDIPELTPPPAGRVDDGLLALYTFEEDSGQVVFDVSGVGAPLNLWIPDLSKINWITGGLSVNSSTLISSFVPGLKLINGLKATEEITIEAWVKPANATQDGPARIATLSKDTGKRNFTLGQDADKYTGRLRTTTTGLNGTLPPAPVFTPSGAVNTSLQHVVYTRTPDTAKMYVDGVEVVSQTIAGNFSNWDSSFQFGLANEFTMNRTWLGDYCLVAVYDKALSASEVSTNFTVGAGTCGDENEFEIVLNEIYPAPPPANENPVAPNDREWIELYNSDASSVDVLGWKISELSGGTGAEQVYTISATCSVPSASKVIPYNGASTIITANGLLVLEFCTGANVLNNPGDTVSLYNSVDTLLDLHIYPSTESGKSHQRIPNGGIWVDPEPTPGEPNRVSMQDLIDAGLDQETIQLIVALLSEKGETLIDEVATEEIVPVEVIEEPVGEATEESQSEIPEAILPEEIIITEESQEVNSEEVMEEVIEEPVLPDVIQGESVDEVIDLEVVDEEVIDEETIDEEIIEEDSVEEIIEVIDEEVVIPEETIIEESEAIIEPQPEAEALVDDPVISE